ncbi:putative gamma-glutamylcyclotransferase [Lupinus albus]|uniref:Gamma-glutamylcyclotransferase family protein n=1 Tax=Lupinus albus TaxID=3870 RepID=A0A6A4NWJ3_LUPAL|nr:putative gamma-glutamylcyclotransferase [Lupinus albus]
MVAEADLDGHNNGDDSRRALIFTYGTLKRGFPNHTLLQDLMLSGDASFVGTYRTFHNYPLVCGPYRVPFLLNIPGSGHRVRGELYSVTAHGLARMDDLEGTTRAHYERLPIKVIPSTDDTGDVGEGGNVRRGNEKRGFVCYGEKEARGYVKRKDRPQHLTFLDHITSFISSSH